MTEARTILVVDDDPEVREGLQTVLRQRGYRTLGAHDGRAARRLIDGRRPDLVILDVLMPQCGGLAVLEHYQERPDAPPFILITANEAEPFRECAARAGAVDYIRKPFSMERLLQGVGKALGEPEESVGEMVRCRCPSCGARIKAPAALLGQTRPCPGCRLPLVVRQAPPPDEDTVLLTDLAPPPGPADERPRGRG
jgi:CheY-like chemotaxis protein